MVTGCIVVLVLCMVSFFALYRRYRRSGSAGNGISHGYILSNSVFHRRFLPEKSQHEFIYTTQSLLLSLRHLEGHQLDLCAGRLFGYGPLRLRCAGISPKNFLSASSAEGVTIGSALQEVLTRDLDGIADRLDDIWMLTMPTYFGVDMNPLTVYFCYDGDDFCIAVVLEVHNTFSERHVYAVKVDAASAMRGRSLGFDHAWIFPKQFHVSPFCERAGFYECAVVVPAAPRSVESGVSLGLPRIRLNLLTSECPTRLRITTHQHAVSMIRLTTPNMLRTVASTPFSWLLTFCRILYQAYILHYHKGLDVYQRPEPHGRPAVESLMPLSRNAVQDPMLASTGIIWLPPSWVDSYAKKCVETFLSRRMRELGLVVELRSTRPSDPPIIFGSPVDNACEASLVLWYRSARAFSIIFETPSPELALKLGTEAEKVFSVSSPQLFTRVFAASNSPFSISSRAVGWLRRSLVPAELRPDLRQGHALDRWSSPTRNLAILLWLSFSREFERRVFGLARARFHRGEEPWVTWGHLDVLKKSE